MAALADEVNDRPMLLALLQCVNSRSANSRRRSPQPSKTASMARFEPQRRRRCRNPRSEHGFTLQRASQLEISSRRMSTEALRKSIRHLLAGDAMCETGNDTRNAKCGQK
jgi:hypothetical protein